MRLGHGHDRPTPSSGRRGSSVKRRIRLGFAVALGATAVLGGLSVTSHLTIQERVEVAQVNRDVRLAVADVHEALAAYLIAPSETGADEVLRVVQALGGRALSGAPADLETSAAELSSAFVLLRDLNVRSASAALRLRDGADALEVMAEALIASQAAEVEARREAALVDATGVDDLADAERDVTAILRLAEALASLRADAFAFLDAPDPGARRGAEQRLFDLVALASDSLDRPEQRAMLDALRNAAFGFSVMIEIADARFEARRMAANDAESALRNLRAIAARLDAAAQTRAAEGSAVAALAAGVAAALAILLGAVIAARVSRSTATRIRRLADDMRRLAGGALHRPIGSIESGDEIGDAARAVEDLRVRLLAAETAAATLRTAANARSDQSSSAAETKTRTARDQRPALYDA